MANLRIKAADDQPSMLVVVLDTDLASWSEAHTASSSPKFILETVVEQLLVFLNAFLLLHAQDRVAVVLHRRSGAKIVYPVVSDEAEESMEEDAFDAGQTSQRGFSFAGREPTEMTRLMRNAVVDGVKESMKAELDAAEVDTKGSGIVAALSMALCLINRSRVSMLRRSISGRERTDTTASVDLATAGMENGQARIFTLFAGKDSPEQYVPMMNCIFSAQRLSVPMDTCVLNPNADSTFFQQAAHLTHGVYLRPKIHTHEYSGGLLQYLLTVFLPDTRSREFLSMPAPKQVDFRASCFSTKNIIDEGYTCSVCLSTFDISVGRKAAVCSICGARYPVTTRLRGTKPPVQRKSSPEAS